MAAATGSLPCFCMSPAHNCLVRPSLDALMVASVRLVCSLCSKRVFSSSSVLFSRVSARFSVTPAAVRKPSIDIFLASVLALSMSASNALRCLKVISSRFMRKSSSLSLASAKRSLARLILSKPAANCAVPTCAPLPIAVAKLPGVDMIDSPAFSSAKPMFWSTCLPIPFSRSTRRSERSLYTLPCLVTNSSYSRLRVVAAANCSCASFSTSDFAGSVYACEFRKSEKRVAIPCPSRNPLEVPVPVAVPLRPTPVFANDLLDKTEEGAADAPGAAAEGALAAAVALSTPGVAKLAASALFKAPRFCARVGPFGGSFLARYCLSASPSSSMYAARPIPAPAPAAVPKNGATPEPITPPA